MSLRVITLASGSAGNSVLLETASSRVLIDAGLHVVDLEARLTAAGVAPRSIDALILTHRHRDHVRGATEFCRKHRVRVHATRRTGRSLGTEARKWLRGLARMAWNEVADDLRVWPVPVEHDAPETVALLIETRDGVRYGHVTDLGCAAGPVGETLTNCDGLYLEFNYDPVMLEAGDYPEQLKRRIQGERGHLSNAAAAELLARLAHPQLRCVWLAHISQRNNTAELALQHARGALGKIAAKVIVAPQDVIGDRVEFISAARVIG